MLYFFHIISILLSYFAAVRAATKRKSLSLQGKDGVRLNTTHTYVTGRANLPVEIHTHLGVHLSVQHEVRHGTLRAAADGPRQVQVCAAEAPGLQHTQKGS